MGITQNFYSSWILKRSILKWYIYVHINTNLKSIAISEDTYIVFCPSGFVRVGGYEEVVRRFFEAYPNTTLLNYNNASYPYWKCGIPPENSMNLVRAYDDGSLPWPGIFFGLTISSVWYWCSDQVSTPPSGDFMCVWGGIGKNL